MFAGKFLCCCKFLGVALNLYFPDVSLGLPVLQSYPIHHVQMALEHLDGIQSPLDDLFE